MKSSSLKENSSVRTAYASYLALDTSKLSILNLFEFSAMRSLDTNFAVEVFPEGSRFKEKKEFNTCIGSPFGSLVRFSKPYNVHLSPRIH